MEKKSGIASVFVAWILSISLLGCTSLVRQAPSVERSNQAATLEKPYVILLSIDGYRYDYTDLYSPPTLKRFRDEGVSTKGLIPVYPSKTFTNHYSIATGLYAENHGIVANQFYDPNRHEEYRLSNSKNVQDATWYGGVPLWVAAEQQGMLAANYFWPGSEAAIQGVSASYFYTYNEKTSHQERLDQVKQWLELPDEKRPHFITLYFSDVDTAGHKFGPGSNEVKEAILKVDRTFAQLLAIVEQEKLPINIVVVSDHGMQQLDPQKVEFLDDYADLKAARVLGEGPQLLLYFEDLKKRDLVYQNFKTHGRHFKVFKREDMPSAYHYSKNPRCGDLIVVADSPYSVGLRSSKSKVGGGNHGYDPGVTPTMKGIFYARGPQVQAHKILEPFSNIHIYPFIMKMLGLKISSPIDGNSSILQKAYRP